MNPIFTNNKIYSHIDRINEWLKKDSCMPVTAELDLTNACNNKCPYCTGGRKNKTQMDIKLAKSIIKQLKKCKVKAINFSGGGESLLHPHSTEIIKYAHGIGLDVGLITNGTMPFHHLLDYCKWIRVSLDASNKKEYKETHGTDHFEKVKKNIFYAVLNNNTRGHEAIQIGVGFLINKKLKKSMEKMVMLGKEMGVSYIQFRPFHYDQTMIKESEMKKLRSKYGTPYFNILYSEHKYKYLYDDRDYDVCYGHNFTTSISTEGLIYLCCHMRGNERYVFGDLKKDKFKKIWKSERRKEVIKNIDFKDCPPVCKCDACNRILFNIKNAQEQIHKNFI